MRGSIAILTTLLLVLGCAGESETPGDSDTDTDTDTGTATDTETATEPDTDTGTETATEPDTATDTGTETESETAVDTDSGTATDTESETVTDTDSDTVADTDTVTDTDSDTDSDSSTESAAAAPQYEGDLIFTELMINPAAVDDDLGEWVELYNATGVALDLQSCVLSDLGTDTHTIDAGGPLVVEPDEYIVLSKSTVTAENGGLTSDYAFGGDIDLGNSGDEILLHCASVEIDRVEWNSTFDTSGEAQELSTNHMTAALNNVLANWCDAVSAYGDGDLGTPGVTNTCSL